MLSSSLWPHIFVFHFNSQTEHSPASHFRCWEQNWNSASHQPPIFRIYKKIQFCPLWPHIFIFHFNSQTEQPPASHFRCWKQNWNSASHQPPIFRIYKKSNFLLTGLTFSYFMTIPKLSSLQPHILGVESKTETQPPNSLPFSEFTKHAIFFSLASHFHISLPFPN